MCIGDLSEITSGMEGLITVFAMVSAPVSLAFTVFVWVRLRDDPNRLLVWSILLSPGLSLFLASASGLFLRCFRDQMQMAVTGTIALLVLVVLASAVLLFCHLVAQVRRNG